MSKPNKIFEGKKRKSWTSNIPNATHIKNQQKKIDKYFADYFVSEDLTKRAVAFSFKNISTM